MRKLIILLLLSAPLLGQTFTTIDQAWLDSFGGNSQAVATANADKSTRTFSIIDSESPPSSRMTVVWDMNEHLDPSDEGKTVKEVTAGPEWRRSFYALYYSNTPGVEEDETQFMVEQDPAGDLGFKRIVTSGVRLPVFTLYFTLTANEPPPDGGYEHAAMSVDMYIPAAMNFDKSLGKSGVGLNLGTRPRNGGSTQPDDQLGAAIRVVRGTEFEKYVRPYVYNLNRLELGWPVHGYQQASEILPMPQGEWIRYELEIKVNDLGTTNGWLKLWMNGVKFSEYENLEMRSVDQPFLINSILMQDMWQRDFDGEGITFPSTSSHFWYSRVRGYLPGVSGDWTPSLNDLNFGIVTTSTNNDEQVSFTNTSGSPISGTVSISGADSTQFSIVSGSSFSSLANGSTHDVVVRYAPSADGQHTASLDVSAGAGASVALTGLSATLQSGTSFNANLGTLISPMADQGSYIETTTNYEGFAVYAVDIPSTGLYEISATVNAGDTADNSFYFAINETTLNAEDIWDISDLTSGMETRKVNIRGNGTFDVPQFKPAVLEFTEGTNYILLGGRENGTQLQDLTFTLIGTAELGFETRTGIAPGLVGL